MKRILNIYSILILGALCSFLFLKHIHAETLRFVVLSDIHFAKQGEDRGLKMLGSVKKVLAEVLEEINNLTDIDFVIFTGDLLIDPDFEELEELTSLLKGKLKKHYYVIPGNHDRGGLDQKGKNIFRIQDFLKAFEGHPYRKPIKQAYWSLDFNSYHLIGLDSTKADSWGGEISAEQIQWLEEDLNRNEEKFTIIFTHHSLLEFYPERDLRGNFFVSNHEVVQEILYKNPQVKFVVSGHYHFPAVILKDGIHHITVPTIITYPCKYALFTITPEKVSMETIPIKDRDLINKAKSELTKAEDWRVRFRSDMHMINLFRGIDSYSFEPRL